MFNPSTAVKDHLGNEYTSISQMAKAYNMKASTLNRRLTSHWPIERALTAGKTRKTKFVVDHLGNIYDGIPEMAKAYGIDKKLLAQRLHDGMSIERALTKEKEGRSGAVKDHKNKRYSSFCAMCKHYGKDPTCVKNNLSKGISLKDALEADNSTEVVDHKGNVFPTQQALCEYYNIERRVYKSRINMGWSIEKALETPVRKLEKGTKEKRLGETKLMSTGLKATIIRYKSKSHITVQFEDGLTNNSDYKSFINGAIAHPTLNPHGRLKGEYCNFTTLRLFGSRFQCECKLCGYKDVLTPNEMKEHFSHVHNR